MSIICVIPTCRPERMETFRQAWKPLFEKHQITLVEVLDGDPPAIRSSRPDHALDQIPNVLNVGTWKANKDLFCTFTDACRNIGFVYAAYKNPDYILTLDDDVVPISSTITSELSKFADPIQGHLDALSRRVPLRWMNTAHDTDLYVRGFPYNVREEASVMLSHGVWVGVPDFDGETQLRLQDRGDGIPHSLPYYVGPIPHGVHFPLCGMNVMIRREALPYFYFAPMGPDSGFPNLHRFADIFCGIHLKKEFDRRGWACYTGASTILHTRASDAKKNVEQEKQGRAFLDECFNGEGLWTHDAERYFSSYADKRARYEVLIRGILEGKP